MKKTTQAGFTIIYTVFLIVLVSAIIALLMFKRGELVQNTTRNTVLESERTSMDRYAQRSAQQVVSTVIANIVNAGGNSVTSANVNAQAGSIRQTRSTADNFFPTSDTTTASQSTSLAAIGTPQFLISAWSPTSSRWSLQTTPSGLYRIFGDKAQFVGRLTEFSSTVGTTGVDRLANRTTATSHAKRISIYEFPLQSFAASGDNIQIASTVVGNVLARNLNLSASANIQSASVYESVSLSSGATIGGTALAAAVNGTAGADVAKGLETGTYGGSKMAEDKISLFRGNEFSSLVILGDTTKDAEGIPQILRQRSAAPTYWDAYTLPYYQCSVRVVATLNAAGTAATVSVYTSDVSTIAGRLTTTLRGSSTVTVSGGFYGFSLISAVGGTATLLQVDPIALASMSGVGIANARALFVDFVNSASQHSPTTIGVSLGNVSDLSTLQGFSFVTPNRLYLRSDINWITPVPMSIFAYDVRYGLSPTSPSRVTHTGQRSIVGTTSAAPIETMRAGNGNVVATTTLSLGNITSPLLVPPVTLLGWLVNVRDQ